MTALFLAFTVAVLLSIVLGWVCWTHRGDLAHGQRQGWAAALAGTGWTHSRVAWERGMAAVARRTHKRR